MRWDGTVLLVAEQAFEFWAHHSDYHDEVDDDECDHQGGRHDGGR